MHWHDTENLARVVAKVYLNHDAKISDSVKVNAGLPQKGHSWTVPCFVLKKQNVTELQDDLLPLGHPRPPQTPHWMEPVPLANSHAMPAESNNGNGMNIYRGGPSRW